MIAIFFVNQLDMELMQTPKGVSLEDWILCLETVLVIVSKIISHPEANKYRTLNKSNLVFHKR